MTTKIVCIQSRFLPYLPTGVKDCANLKMMFSTFKQHFAWEGKRKEGQGFKLSPENNLSWPRN